MKRFILISVALGLFAGTASAALYQLDAPTALSFSYISNTDSGAFPATGDLDLVAANPSIPYGFMTLDVGYAGGLGDGSDAGNTAAIRIGVTQNTVGDFTEFQTVAANDDDDPWAVQLFAIGSTSGEKNSGFVTLAPGATTSLLVTGLSGTITQFGLDIRGTFTGLEGASPSNPDFYHISVVPVPAAVVLGMLGLGVAGWRLRRFA